MKKVGLITFYGENYGGMLQAYALQRYVKALGYECRVISNDFLYGSDRPDKAKLLVNKIRILLKNPADYLKRRNAMRSAPAEQALKSEKFRQFCADHIEVDQTGYTSYEQYVKNPPRYDVYLCGSDQIWNPNLYYSNGFYFGDFAPEGALRAAYASSIGVSSVTPAQADFMKPYLDKIDVLSTRETDGSAIVERITGRKTRTVIDPTLLLNEEQWMEVTSQPVVEGSYVFCYLFGEREYIAQVKEQVKQLTGMKLVCIPCAAREMSGPDEKVFDAGPAEFISLIKHASLVLTDSFHATAFSINLKTPFLSLCRFSKNDAKGMNSRLHTILGAMGLGERLIDENDEITKEMLFSVDFEKAHKNLNALREADGGFLKDALQYKGGYTNAQE